VLFWNFGEISYYITKGQQIAQLILTRFETPQVQKVSYLDQTKMNPNGFSFTETYQLTDTILIT